MTIWNLIKRINNGIKMRLIIVKESSVFLSISLYILLSILVITGLYAKNNELKSVEGIFYLDGTPISIEISEGKITGIIRNNDFNDGGNSRVYIAPGLIDNQVNGYVQVSFVFSGGELTVERVRKATWKEGVTTYFPTLTTSSHEVLIKNFKVLAEALKDPEISRSIPGFHLEGPYISPVDGFRGAHPKQWVRPPDWTEFLDFYNAANKKIIQVSLAPEMDGAMDFIEKCVQRDIKVALAHHNGSAEIIKKAIDRGAVIATHLGNGCANMIHRHSNPLWQQLADDRMMASIIVDGFHLRQEEVQVFYKIKGPDNLIITSDVTSLAGMPPGEYESKGRKVILTPQGMIKYPAQNVLAGSASPITKGVGNIMKFTQCSLAEAIDMASKNPARLYDLSDRGEIIVGKRADLILFTLENYILSVKKTIIAGEVVYSGGNSE
jgi:N-acetylglucosamine-6-phosphate deacetylase